MRVNPPITDTKPAAVVLQNALFKLASHWALSQNELAALLGLSEPTVTRLKTGKGSLAIPSSEAERALLLVKIFRSLDALLGENQTAIETWLKNPHAYFIHSPIESMRSITGLVEVSAYLDAMRGKM